MEGSRVDRVIGFLQTYNYKKISPADADARCGDM